jgi:hypothetical protein
MSTDLTISFLIDAIYDEAHRRMQGDASLHEDFAYLLAIVAVVKRSAHAQRLTRRQKQVLGAVQCIQTRVDARRGIGRQEVARELDLQGIEISEWTISMTCRELEACGLLYRDTPRAKTWRARSLPQQGEPAQPLTDESIHRLPQEGSYQTA